MTSKEANRIRMHKEYWKDPEKYRQKSRDNIRRNPETPRARIARLIKNRYGLDIIAYEKLVATAKGICVICRKKTKLTIDHCHKTGRVRGLLCGNCNRGLGLFFESPEALANAIKYIS